MVVNWATTVSLELFPLQRKRTRKAVAKRGFKSRKGISLSSFYIYSLAGCAVVVHIRRVSIALHISSIYFTHMMEVNLVVLL